MRYKIEYSKIMGVYHYHLYLGGWVHLNQYTIRVRSGQKVLVETHGHIHRTDIAKKFHESPLAGNVYGFYRDIKLKPQDKKITVELQCGAQTKIIKTVYNFTICRYINTIHKHFVNIIAKIRINLRRQRYLLEILSHPTGWFNQKYRQYVKEKYVGMYPKRILDCWSPIDYAEWAHKYETFSKVQKLKYQPKISVVIPVYNPPEDLFDDCIESVLNQTYKNFEICLADDCSPDPRVKEMLKKYEQKDKRIKVVYRKKNGGISEATNSALKLASGEFVALLDNDDILVPQALYENVKVLNDHNGELDFIYSDENQLNLDGERCNPHFKADWAPDTLMSYNYITHFAVLRRSIMMTLGGFITKYNGAQDFDMFLRFTEQTTPERIYHIPHVLYHWRMSPTSTAFSIGSKNYAVEAGRSALEDALKRRRIKGVAKVFHNTYYTVEYDPPKNKKVSIINMSDCGNLQEAAIEATGDYLLFIDDSIRKPNKKVLNQMMGFAQQKHIGVVGIKTHSSCRVEQAAMILGSGPFQTPRNVFKGFQETDRNPRLQVPHNYSVVSPNCYMISKKKFKEIGGFDDNISSQYKGVDLCLNALQHNFYNVCVPWIEIEQQPQYDNPEVINRIIKDSEYLKKKWGQQFINDRFYNSNWSLKYPFTLRGSEK